MSENGCDNENRDDCGRPAYRAAGTNDAMLVAAVFLIQAWKIAGYFGLDYHLLSGTPW
jgi:hypothetical protein